MYYFDVVEKQWYNNVQFDVVDYKYRNVYMEKCAGPEKENEFIFPGLIDCHTHMLENPNDERPYNEIYEDDLNVLIEVAKNNLKLSLQSGITTIVDFGGRQMASINVKKELCRRRTMDKDTVLPRIITSGCYLTMPKGHATTRGAIVLYDKYDICKFIKYFEKNDVKIIKVLLGHNSFDLESLKYICTIAHSNKFIVCAHAYLEEDAHLAVESGVDVLEHVGDYSDDLLDTIKEKNIIVVPTYISSKDSVKSFNSCNETFSDTCKNVYLDWYNGEKTVIPKLFSKKIRVALGTDAGFSGTPFNSLVREILELHRDFNISMEELATCAYLVNPEVLNCSDSLGKIKNGFLADYIVYEKNPLEFPEILHNPKAVYIGGIQIK